jgi:nucleoside-triphosphatase THEP1
MKKSFALRIFWHFSNKELPCQSMSMSRQLRILITGCPGSGKGTLSNKLCNTFNGAITLFSSGDLFRHHITQGTEIGKKISGLLKRGELVSDELAISLIMSELKKVQVSKLTRTSLKRINRAGY